MRSVVTHKNMTESGYLLHILLFSAACFVLGSINASGRHHELVRIYAKEDIDYPKAPFKTLLIIFLVQICLFFAKILNRHYKMHKS